MKNKARYLDDVSGKTPLPSASSSELAFDSTVSDIVTLSGCGDCSGLSEVEWTRGGLFVAPNKNKVFIPQHHVDVNLSPISPE